MRQHIAICLQYKLKTTDSILPIAMELAAQHPQAEIWFLFPDLETYNLISKNYILSEAIAYMGGVPVAVRRSNIFWSALNLLRLFIVFSFSRVVFIRFGSTGIPKQPFFIDLLRRVSEVLDIKCFLPPNPRRALFGLHAVERYKRRMRGQPEVVDMFQPDL